MANITRNFSTDLLQNKKSKQLKKILRCIMYIE